MTTSKFNMTKDIAGYNGFGLVPSNVIFGVSLETDTAQNFTVPSDYAQYIVVFSYGPGATVFVNATTTAAAYTTTIGAVTSELNPNARSYPKGTVVSLLTPDSAGAYVEAAIYVVNPYQN